MAGERGFNSWGKPGDKNQATTKPVLHRYGKGWKSIVLSPLRSFDSPTKNSVNACSANGFRVFPSFPQPLLLLVIFSFLDH
ncbi:MAG TPA: hypothetical protein DEB19_06675 [Synechococcales bacterium UBA8138]|nr:hypothetical protein [Synechococcales bacterium UBA8138]